MLSRHRDERARVRLVHRDLKLSVPVRGAGHGARILASMATTAGSPYGRPFLSGTAPRAGSIVRKQIRTAIALTLFTAALTVTIAVALGPDILFIFLLPLPVPLALLWLSTGTVRVDEGGPLLPFPQK